MRTGRPRKPTILKLVTGTQRASRVNPLEPKVEAGCPKAPAHLTPRARKAWRYFMPILRRMRVLTVADGVALERMCETYAEILEAQESLGKALTYERVDRKTGETTTVVIGRAGESTYVSYGSTGVVQREREELSRIAAADSRLRNYLSAFGLTPASRSKVNVLPEEHKADPAAKYFG